MTRLDQFLECDSENVPISLKNLTGIYPGSLDAIEQCAAVIENIGQAYSTVCGYDEYQQVVNTWAQKLDLRGNEALVLLEQATIIGSTASTDLTVTAQAAYQSAKSAIARTELILRSGRDFLFGISDLLRVRITPALGYLRLQSETFALLRLLVDQPQLGVDWLNSLRDGQKFYGKWHSRIVETIKSLDLHHDYSRGSEMAFHVRQGGTILGTLLGSANATRAGEIRLHYQEVSDPRMFFYYFGLFLRFHRKALTHLGELFPEISSDDLNGIGLETFLKVEDQIWTTTRRVYESMRRDRIENVRAPDMEMDSA